MQDGSSALELKCSGTSTMSSWDILSVLFHIYRMGLMTALQIFQQQVENRPDI